jgi:hypothetical protein
MSRFHSIWLRFDCSSGFSRHSAGVTTVTDLAVSSKPSLARRLVVIALVALLSYFFALWKLHQAGPGLAALDFTVFWRGALALVGGESPYRVINPAGVYPFDSGYLYPLPAAVVIAPFTLLASRDALPLFVALSVALFTFAITRENFARLPLLLSFPVLWSCSTGQWPPLIAATALLPAFGWIAAAKPTLGVAAFAYNLSWRFAALAVGFTVLSVILWPWWPREWLAELGQRTAINHRPPLLLPGGVLLLLAVLRWRRPEARLLLAMAVVPQTVLFYDQLPLLLVAITFRESLIAGLLSFVPYAIATALRPSGNIPDRDIFAITGPLIMAFFYLPALAIILRRQNVGCVPAWLERTTRWLPPAIRGAPA